MADDGLTPDDGLLPDDATQVDAALAVVARHALHDEEIVVALATGSLDPADDAADVERARALMQRCTACRDLHRDIAAIGEALRLDARGSAAAPRDFRLTVEDARRLGGPVSVGGFLSVLRRSMASVARLAGASMAALGIVGLLIGSFAFGSAPASAPLAGATDVAVPTGAPAEITTGEQPGDPKSSGRNAAEGPQFSTDAPGVDSEPPSDTAAVGPSPAAWLLGGSVVLLVAGVLLLAATFRRGRRDSAGT